MSKKPIDIGAMFKEIEMIRKKYGIPKGMMMLPDKMEIVLERKDTNKFDLTYMEFFNYIPNSFIDRAIEMTLQVIQQMDILPENITRKEKGVKIQMSGDFQVVHNLITELLMQNEKIEFEIELILKSLRKNYQMWSNFSDYYWDWSDEIEAKYNNLIMTLNKIMQEYPQINSEMEAIRKKYTSHKDYKEDT